MEAGEKIFFFSLHIGKKSNVSYMTQFSAHRRLGILIIPVFTCSDIGKVLITRGKHH